MLRRGRRVPPWVAALRFPLFSFARAPWRRAVAVLLVSRCFHSACVGSHGSPRGAPQLTVSPNVSLELPFQSNALARDRRELGARPTNYFLFCFSLGRPPQKIDYVSNGSRVSWHPRRWCRPFACDCQYSGFEGNAFDNHLNLRFCFLWVFSSVFVCGGSRTSRTGAPLLCGTFPHQPSLPTLCFLCWLRVSFHLFCNGFLLWRPRLAVPPVALLAATMSYSMSSPAWLPLFSFGFCSVPPRSLRFLVSCSTPPRHRVW